jgi:trehalose 6-phosphate synthase
MPENPARSVVIASNRGPVGYRVEKGELVARRGSGGLVSGLGPIVEEGRATWIAAALSEADRRAAAQGLPAADGFPVELLPIDEEDHRLAYDVVSNETLWFAHHGLFDLTRTPAYDDRWWDAWSAYRRVNETFAEAVCEHAAEGAAVLVQDYHLTLLAPTVQRERPDLALVHFHHTPFAGPDGFRVLPPAARSEMLESLSSHRACGFHTSNWAANFGAVLDRWGTGSTTPDGSAGRCSTFVSPLSTDPADLHATAASADCEAHFSTIDAWAGDRRLIVRIDRMELSKNIVRGFAAFDLLLQRRADLRGRVSFLAYCYPSREGVEAYAVYRREVEAAAARVNERWGDTDWQPVTLETNDDYPRSVAALRRYDVLLVNPIRDGLNLVAKEGPLVNERDGQLVLSTEAGAWAELSSAADGVCPFDLADTADALAQAIDRPAPQRSERSAELRRLVSSRTPADWLADQLAAAG